MLDRCRARADTGVVHQDLKTSEPLAHFFDESHARFRSGHVVRERNGTVTE